MRLGCAIVWGLCLLLCCGPGMASTHGAGEGTGEVVHLKNGDRLTVRILEETGESLRVRTGWQAEISLPKSDIIRREPLASVQAGETTGAGERVSAEPPAAVSAEPDPRRGKWTGNLQLGGDLRLSQVNSHLYNLNFRAGYQRGDFHNNFDYRYAYGRTDGNLSANRMEGTVKSDFDVGVDKEWFLYLLGGAGYDEVRRISYQYQAGPGVGRHLVVRTNFALNAELGVSYQEQQFTGASGRRELRLRLGEDFFWRFSPRLTLEHKAELLPGFDDPSDYRLRIELGLSYVLWKNMAWNVNLTDIRDSRPAAGVTRNDLQIRSGLGVSF